MFIFKMAELKPKHSEKKKRGNQKTKKETELPLTEAVETEIKNGFNLEDVLYLGGEKGDYESLKDLDEDEEVESDETQQDGEDLNSLHTDIQSLISSIGLTKVEITESKILSEEDVGKTDDEKLECFKQITTLLENHTHEEVLLRDIVPWYQLVEALPKTPSSLETSQLTKLHELAKKCWLKEVEIYQTARENDKSSDVSWLRTVLKSGTQSDKVSGLTVLAQESPIHCMRSLESLLNMTKKKARREALMAVDSLRHLWVSDLLPDFKLKSFSQYCIEDVKLMTKDGRKDSQLKLMMAFAFEHELKTMYADFVDTIQILSKDPLVNIRTKLLGIIFELLVMKPEQEQQLLSILVNKLGDPDRKVASKASFLLSQLISKHPNMKGVVIQDVERMIFRPNVSDKAQFFPVECRTYVTFSRKKVLHKTLTLKIRYYAICFLNQIELSHDEKEVASKLISIYFSFFKIIATKQKKKSAIDSQQTKLLSGLLTGVNRAYPYTEGEENNYDEQLNTLFRLTHIQHLSTSIQAFMLIYQVMESRQSVTDRYYQALYDKVLDAEVKNSLRHTLLLNLLYKSLKNDPVLKRVKSFMKRLLQVASLQQPSFLCGVLFLLSEISLYSNSILKRIDSILCIVKRVIRSKPGLKTMIEQAEEEDDDEEEHFVDVPLSDDENKEETTVDEKNISPSKDDKNADSTKNKGWTFVNDDNRSKIYNIRHRNPLYSGAEYSCSWEVCSLLSHYHPSVQHFTQSIVKEKGTSQDVDVKNQNESIDYKGDPLQDFTLIRFLDRFMYRNPKKTLSEHGSSIMQRTDQSQRLKEEPVNSKAFLQKSEDTIRQDELFFHRYFKQKEAVEKKTKKVEDEQEDVKDVDEFEIDNIYDVDFASDMKNKRDVKSKNKDSDDEDDDDEGELSDDGSFDYNQMADESEEEDFDNMPSGGKQHFNDKDYEDALFENLNSEGESDDEDQPKNVSSGNNGLDSMFAAADEFAHLLEKGDNNDGIHPKQKRWEARHDNNKWKKPQHNSSRKRKRNNFSKQHSGKKKMK